MESSEEDLLGRKKRGMSQSREGAAPLLLPFNESVQEAFIYKKTELKGLFRSFKDRKRKDMEGGIRLINGDIATEGTVSSSGRNNVSEICWQREGNITAQMGKRGGDPNLYCR